jgi:imidazolonepropionase-like amidohydrolase
MYDGIEDTIKENMQILVEGDRIAEVDKHVSAPAGTETINLSDATVTPGLIDAHVHLGTGDWRTRNHDTIYQAPIYHGMFALHNARKAMKRGFTTLRHCGCNCNDAYSIVTAKRMINSGWFEGSSLVVAPHYLCTTRGHGDSSQLVATNPPLATHIWEEYPGYGCGTDMFREVVRRQAKYGADFIKIFSTGGFNSEGDGPEDEAFTDEELHVIVETAHYLNKKVVSHAYAPKLVRKQLDAGVDDIEHGALIDDPALLARMKEQNVDFVPTFSPYDSVIFMDSETLSKYSDGMQRKLKKYAEWLGRARKAIVDSDVEIGYGSDFVAAHNCYNSGYEYRSMIKSGVKPFRALAAATRVNAKILGMQNAVGTLAPGCFADVAAWKRDLLTDADALLDCHFVMKGGNVYPVEKDI